MSRPNQPRSCSNTAFHGCRSRNFGRSAAIAASRRRMKSSWIGIGFSHHNVPSLSNTATRSSGGTGWDPSSPHVRATKSTSACLVAPSRQLASSVSVTLQPSGALAGADHAGTAGGAQLFGTAGPGSFAHEHHLSLALEVDVRFAADVNSDAVDGAAGEAVG